MQKVMLAALQLVFPPLSNQEAEWARNDEGFLEAVRSARLYMIAQRREIFFRNYSFDGDHLAFRFDLEFGDDARRGLSVELPMLADQELNIEIGPKMFRAWNADHSDVVFWFTVEGLLQYVWRRELVVTGLDAVIPFTQFDLLYVGISKENDAFARLVAAPHEKRVQILTNEFPLRPGARVSDEVYFFLFDVSALQANTFGIDDDDVDQLVESLLNPKPVEPTSLVADAEKAFVNVLEAKYNTIRFATYPKGRDGLYAEGLTRFGYVIDEDLTFSTGTTVIRGAHGTMPTPHAKQIHPSDCIFVEGDDVTLVTHEEMLAEQRRSQSGSQTKSQFRP